MPLVHECRIVPAGHAGGREQGHVLIIAGGLPGTGKTTPTQLLSARIGAVHLRIDTIEQAIVRLRP
ncbi:AAA family ATPase [Nocardia sp. alder85J]|uniref:AAA family ATPase n=1 Tax=Nocardia sp. alder85J TaxID=2862949 RepID=UPI002259984C|nr:hypothetical protein [Nocardia sp. alder85J]MCX4096462.1 hypothetical protein [Nocardia sp. alder85J]